MKALCNLSIDLSELENELFSIKIRNDINVAPLRSYIEENLKWVADEIQQENHQANRKNTYMEMHKSFVYQSSYSSGSHTKTNRKGITKQIPKITYMYHPCKCIVIVLSLSIQLFHLF
jgi:hypothetical protein